MKRGGRHSQYDRVGSQDNHVQVHPRRLDQDALTASEDLRDFLEESLNPTGASQGQSKRPRHEYHQERFDSSEADEVEYLGQGSGSEEADQDAHSERSQRRSGPADVSRPGQKRSRHELNVSEKPLYPKPLRDEKDPKALLLKAANDFMYASRNSFAELVAPLVSPILINDLTQEHGHKLLGAFNSFKKEIIKCTNKISASIKDDPKDVEYFRRSNLKIREENASLSERLRDANGKNCRFKISEGQLLREVSDLKSELSRALESSAKKRPKDSSPDKEQIVKQNLPSCSNPDKDLRVNAPTKEEIEAVEQACKNLKSLKMSVKVDYRVWYHQLKLKMNSLISAADVHIRLKEAVELKPKKQSFSELLKLLVQEHNHVISSAVEKLSISIKKGKSAVPKESQLELYGLTDTDREEVVGQFQVFKDVLKEVEAVFQIISGSDLVIDHGAFEPTVPFSVDQQDHIVNLVGPHCFDGMKPLARDQVIGTAEFLLASYKQRKKLPEAFRIFGLQAISQMFNYDFLTNQKMLSSKAGFRFLGRELLAQIGELNQSGLQACNGSGRKARHCCTLHSLGCSCDHCIRILAMSGARSGYFENKVGDSFHAIDKATDEVYFLGRVTAGLNQLSARTMNALAESGLNKVPKLRDSLTPEAMECSSDEEGVKNRGEEKGEETVEPYKVADVDGAEAGEYVPTPCSPKAGPSHAKRTSKFDYSPENFSSEDESG